MRRLHRSEISISSCRDGSTLILALEGAKDSRRFIEFRPETDQIISGEHIRKCAAGDSCLHSGGSYQPLINFIGSQRRGRNSSPRIIVNSLCFDCLRPKSEDRNLTDAYKDIIFRNYGVDLSSSIPQTFRGRYSSLLARHTDKSTRLTSPVLLAALWYAQGQMCPISGWRLSLKYAHLDHITPIRAGGGGGISNLIYIHKIINKSKMGVSLQQFCSYAGFDFDEIYHRISSVHDLMRQQGFEFD